MNWKRHTSSVLMVGIVLLTTIGCSRRLSPESQADSPRYHVNQGLRLLERGELDDARNAFKRAKDLDGKFADAYAGLALIEANFEKYAKANEYLEMAYHRGKKNPWIYVVDGRIITMQKKGKRWHKNAEGAFERAVKRNSEMAEAWFYWGIADKEAYKFNDAANKFARVIEIGDEWASLADKEYQVIQDIQRASPGSTIGNKIALMQTITRADLAVLFIEELKLEEVLRKNKDDVEDTSFTPPDNTMLLEGTHASHSGPSDIKDHWAETWIRDVLGLGTMEISPDNRYYPDEKITRAEFALFIQNILIDALHDESYATQYITETSRFKDMRSGTATYNAAALCVDRGIMDATIKGKFLPMDSVSGAEALITIRQFQNELRMSFN